MRVLVTDISELVTNDPEADDLLGVCHDAAFIAEDGIVAWVGPASEAAAQPVDQVVRARGRAVIPGFVDSHSHPLFAGDRSEEFAARMAGSEYSAGGIRSTVEATRRASDQELEDNLTRLIAQAEHSGTTTLEIKSGYGLTVDDELRQLDIAVRYSPETTLMAAHVVPPEYAEDPDGYVDLIIDRLIPAAAERGVRWIDVFCERGAFTEEQTDRLLTAGAQAGLLPRLHANQLTAGGALKLAAAHGAASADHATFASDEDLAALAAAGTVATLLPSIEFSTRQPYPDARRYFAAGVTVAIASDCNPGSGFSSSLPFCIAIAVRDMHFTVEQALWAATAGGAAALRRTDIGRLTPGARADFAVLDAPGYRYLAYRPGVQQIAQVYRAGSLIAANPSPYMSPAAPEENA
ncbi:imidazolonepropionase [Brevibacterium sp. 5221]|uniref:Imidazolonepropionase n=1 Tax=Brevibacterium rongguiense TaxID=2695267 RepID=A0A6N9H5D3_9MICO|nr:imidazolonepropionase [Brevibacterium rongguiense]MYM18882.1 imidazolonepropionase [Brevibacterium rongguiense]